jgi:hypothetical protein
MEKIKLKRCPNGMRRNYQGDCIGVKNTKIESSPLAKSIVKSVSLGNFVISPEKTKIVSNMLPVNAQINNKTKRNRCPNKMRRNKQGECVAIQNNISKTPLKTVIKSPIRIKDTTPPPITNKSQTKKSRCPKGMRKNKNGDCTDTKPTVFAKIPDESVKLLPTSNIKLDTIEEQCDYYNSSQDNFVFTQANKNTIRITNKRDGTGCGKIIIEEKDYIYIDLIGKCGTASGTSIIKAIEDFAHKCKYRKLGLEDDSRLGTRIVRLPEGGVCEMFLSAISILTTGETWYNKLGYKSEWYDKEVAHNKRIIAKPFLSFMNKDVLNIAKTYGWQDDWFTEFEATMKECDTIVPKSKLEKISVQDFFIILQNKLRGKPIDCNDQYSLLCVRLIKAMDMNGGFVTRGWETREANNIVIHRMDSNREPVIQYKYL